MRYNSQIKVSYIGKEGHQKITESKVLLVGVGGVGSIVLPYLRCTNLSVCDPDVVEESNLGRQIAFNDSMLNEPKTNTIFGDDYTKYHTRVQNLSFDYDLIVDCSDNYETKKFLSSKNIPIISCGVGVSIYQLYLFTNNPNRLVDFIGNNDGNETIVLGPVCGECGSKVAFNALYYLAGNELDDMIINSNVLTNEVTKCTL